MVLRGMLSGSAVDIWEHVHSRPRRHKPHPTGRGFHRGARACRQRRSSTHAAVALRGLVEQRGTERVRIVTEHRRDERSHSWTLRERRDSGLSKANAFGRAVLARLQKIGRSDHLKPQREAIQVRAQRRDHKRLVTCAAPNTNSRRRRLPPCTACAG
jgi:hypothetical protein